MLPGFWAVQGNQAGLAWIENPALGFHHENPFLVKGLAQEQVAVVLPARPGVLGLSYAVFGNSGYHESRTGLCFSRKFRDHFAAAIQLDYFHTVLPEDYGRQGRLGVEAGLLMRPVENLLAGIHVFNPVPSGNRVLPADRLPVKFRLGVAYHFGEDLLVGMEGEKDLEHPPVWKAGMQYCLTDHLRLRTGTCGQPASFSFGLGYQGRRIQADFAFSRHQVLGYTPHFSCIILLW